MLLSYTIRQKRNDIENTKWEPICVTHNSYLNQSYYILEHLSNGNYSIQIAAISMAGTGNYTPVKYVVIMENTGDIILMVVIGLLIALLALIIVLITAFKCYYNSSISSMKLIANVNPDYAGVHYKQVNTNFTFF